MFAVLVSRGAGREKESSYTYVGTQDSSPLNRISDALPSLRQLCHCALPSGTCSYMRTLHLKAINSNDITPTQDHDVAIECDFKTELVYWIRSRKQIPVNFAAE